MKARLLTALTLAMWAGLTTAALAQAPSPQAASRSVIRSGKLEANTVRPASAQPPATAQPSATRYAQAKQAAARQPAAQPSRAAAQHGAAQHGAAQHAMPQRNRAFNIPRERRWIKLQYWLRGQKIPSKPDVSVNIEDPFLLKLGAQLFDMYCANCHGAEGRGDGPRAAGLQPRPRDLASGMFKFRSTPSGEPPTPQDLFQTISGGLRGTGMLPFADLPEMQRWALVAHVTKLAGTAPGEFDLGPVEIPPQPKDLSKPARIARGRQIYTKLGCDKCHGAEGRGDGPSANEQVDAYGVPMAPRDFVIQPLKRGEYIEDVYRTIVTGLDGTPMPGYLESASSEEIWDLIAFVRSLPSEGFNKVSPLEIARARELVNIQQGRGQHAVVSGCGCGSGG